MKKTKRKVLLSVLSLMLSLIMLTGTTYAWFTDSVTSAGNKIESGNLKLDLELLDQSDNTWKSIKESKTPLFTHENWEPGYVDVTVLKVENEGSLALKWEARFVSVNGVSELAKAIDVYVKPSATEIGYPASRNEISAANGWQNVGTLDQFIDTLSDTTYGSLEKDECAYLGIALKMQESAGNEYQNLTLGAFDILIVATQMSSETDDLGTPDYDNDAEYPEFEMNFETTTSLDGVATLYNELAEEVIIRHEATGAYAVIPAGVKLKAGATSLSFSGKSLATGGTISDSARNYDIHIEGIADDNTKCITVYIGAILPAGIADTSLKLYHEDTLMTRVNSVSDFAMNNQFTYDPATGAVVLYVDNFSVFSAVETSADEWDGTSDIAWYNDSDTEFTLTTAEQFAGFRDLVDGGNTFAGKTVKLGADIDLADKPFDPIGFGYYDDDDSDGKTNYRVFMGTFDGAGHTIYNLYENCWELDPDKESYSTYTYSTAGAGLFASIKDATIKNLAVSGAEIVFECVDMGVVVGYAQGTCHFENIVVTNSNIANYNRYTGGVVGEVSYGPYGIDKTLGYSHTFKNVTVDSTVKVSGLWGSFGCGMGGVIGGKWGDATVKMENVISAAEMDVYNDVVSAYQWYAFRGCGMLIGHTEEPYSDGRHSGNATASFLTCENVKVYYGDWVNYNYYEFEKQENTTGQRYPWVRAEAGEYCDAFSNIRYGVPTHGGVKVSDLTEEQLKAVATDYTPIVFDQLYGADRGMYGTAVHDGVTVTTLASTKTIYIYNETSLEELKFTYWYRNGEETWSTVLEPISMESFKVDDYPVYKLVLHSFIDGFTITHKDDSEGVDFVLSDLNNGDTYTPVGNIHTHSFTDNKCPCGAETVAKYEKLTNLSELNAGDLVVFVYEADKMELSSISTYGTGTAYTDSPNGIMSFEVVEGSSAGTYAFKNNNKYLNWTSGNSLSLSDTLTDSTSWAIAVNETGNTIVKNAKDTTRVIQWNTSSPRFACYTSSQAGISIYIYSNKITCAACEMQIIEQKDATCEESGYVISKCSVCGKQTEETINQLDHIDDNADKVCDNCETTLSGSGEWVNISINDINSTDVVVIVWTKDDSSWALTDGNGASDAPAATRVEIISNQLSGDIPANIQWNISNNNGDLTIYPNGTTATWLYCTATNNGVRVGTNANKIFTIDASSGYLKNTATNRFLGVYTTTPDVRCYTSTGTNITDQTLSFYKYVDSTFEQPEVTETDTELVTEPETEPATEPETEPVTEPETEPTETETEGITEPTVVLEITKDDFNSTSYAANNNTKTEGDYSYTSYQVMNQSSVMQWQKSKGYITIASNAFVKLELKVTAGTYTVTVGEKTVTGTTSNGVTTYDLTGLTGEIKISVGSATGKVDYLKFYK